MSQNTNTNPTQTIINNLSTPCANGVTHEHYYGDCEHGPGPGERSSECPICREDMNESECITTHTKCGWSFHTDCLDAAFGHIYDRGDETDADSYYSDNDNDFYDRHANHATSEDLTYVNTDLVPCPICRGVCIVTTPVHVQDEKHDGSPFPFSRFARDWSIADVVQMLRQGARCSFYSREILARPHQWSYDPFWSSFAARWFTRHPDTGEYPSASVPLYEGNNFDIFQRARVAQAGALAVTRPGRRLKLVLLTPTQVVIFLRTLHAAGWCPSSGVLVRRLDLSEVRNLSFENVIKHAAENGIETINHYQLASLFPDCEALWDASRTLHVEIRAPTDTDNKIRICVVTGRWSVKWTWTTYRFNELDQRNGLRSTLDIVDELGGLGDSVKLTRWPAAFSRSLFYYDIYYNDHSAICQPLGPLTSREEDCVPLYR